MWKIMKRRLRAVLVCLIVAYVCGCCDHHVHCSEEMPAGPEPSLPQESDQRGESASESGDKVDADLRDSVQSSYEVGLATERASLGETRSQDTLQESDEVTDTQEHVVEDTADQVPAREGNPNSRPSGTQEEPAPTAATELADTQGDPSSIPTSQAPPTSLSSASDASHPDSPVLSSVDAEPSAASCEAGDASMSDSTPPSVPDNRTGNASDSYRMEEEKKTNVSTALDPRSENVTGLDHSGNASRVLTEKAVEASGSREDPAMPNKDHGDIPTFDEWKKKVMEVEKEKSQSTHTSSSNGGPVAVKKVQKNLNNYASVECGAKILAANPEAKSTSAILMENMDLYMLNPCSNKIWFVIELCEPIQVKQVDIANFELFSSTPKDFLVSISDRYPTNKWIKLGTFHARDERTVQSFPLDEQLYAKYVKMFIKYIKVELLSHFGSEHFCPLSLIRVFGTSMVEEYEEIAESQYPSERFEYLDEDYDYPLGYSPLEDKSSKNLIGSATNAILNMVNNIAANVLGASPDTAQGASEEANVSVEVVNVTEASLSTPISPTPTSAPGLETMPADLPPLVQEPSSLPTETSAPAVPENSPIVTFVKDDEDEEEPVQSTVTLLTGDEEVEELVGTKDRVSARQLESLVYCGELSSISCSASPLEHLRLWCSSSLSLQRRHRERQKRGETQADSQYLDAPMQSGHVESFTEEQSNSVQEETAGEAEDLRDSGHTAEMSAEQTVEPVQLEPSRSSSLPLHSFTDLGSEETTSSVNLESSAKVLLEQGLLYQEKFPEEQEEEKKQPLVISSSGSMDTSISTTSSVEEPEPDSDTTRQETVVTMTKRQPSSILPTITRPCEVPPPTEVPFPQADTDTDASHDAHGELQKQAPSAEGPSLELKSEDLDDLLTVTSSNGQPHRMATDFYAEQQNSSDLTYANGNSNHIHGSNQKESVFMRLNNRIKALEMNMSLSGRYLEELSQRYRKQMEEMQRAFNKTITKLQNTSRIAEEQDQRQTESIQLLQSKLQNVTQLLVNLSATVTSLQTQLSDRQSYLMMSLVLCVFLGMLLFVQCCRGAAPLAPEPDDTVPRVNIYPSPKRCFSSYDVSLTDKVPRPLVRSKSDQIPPTEIGPDDNVELLKFTEENKKKKRCKMKPEKVEILTPLMTNGGLKCNGTILRPPVFTDLSSCREPACEGSSDGSSHSEDSYFCGISACTRLCNGQPLPRGKLEKRRRARAGGQSGRAGELLPPLRDMMKGTSDVSMGVFRVPTVSGPV